MPKSYKPASKVFATNDAYASIQEALIAKEWEEDVAEGNRTASAERLTALKQEKSEPVANAA